MPLKGPVVGRRQKRKQEPLRDKKKRKKKKACPNQGPPLVPFEAKKKGKTVIDMTRVGAGVPVPVPGAVSAGLSRDVAPRPLEPLPGDAEGVHFP